MLVPGTEPFLISGSRRGCLLIHGFTGAPTEMVPLGEYLAHQGYSVLGVRLFGHGTDIKDMHRARWEDWVNSVLDGWNLLNGITDQITIIGLSMGGVLALYNSANLPVNGVVSLSTPFTLGPDPRLPFLPLLSKFVPHVSKGKDDWHDPDADKEHFSYDYYPTRAVSELHNLLQEMQDALPKIRVPALLIHSHSDLSVPVEHLELIANNLGTDPDLIRKKYLKTSGHVITRDDEKDIVFEEVTQFVNGLYSN